MSELTWTHLRALANSVASHPHAPVFKLPIEGETFEWRNVTYAEFQSDIDRMSKYWHEQLTSKHIEKRSIVGIWLPGLSYDDAVNIYAVSRAGFLPQMFGYDLPNVSLVIKLLSNSNAKALIYGKEKASSIREQEPTIELSTFLAISCNTITESFVSHIPLPVMPAATPEDAIFLYLSSGSVSGMPKTIPTTNGWLAALENKALSTFFHGSGEGQSQDIYIWNTTFSHCMQIRNFQLILHRSGCIVQAAHLKFNYHEFAEMIIRAGVNRVIMFGGPATECLECARSGKPEPRLLALLQGLREYTYSGMKMPADIANWALEQNIPITNMYGSTECGRLMISTNGDLCLKVLPGVKHEFIPTEAPEGNGSAYSRLCEFRVLPGSPDLPDPTLCDEGGGWRSGDLFEQVGDGKYTFRGRVDDWIKSYSADRIDTNSIENNVYVTCADIVSSCVVVGNGRLFPALFVEPKTSNFKHIVDTIKAQIIERISDFHSSLFFHERITDERMIMVVPAGSLPRTGKGNIKRRAVEGQYAAELEVMYSGVPVGDIY